MGSGVIATHRLKPGWTVAAETERSGFDSRQPSLFLTWLFILLLDVSLELVVIPFDKRAQ